MRPKGVMALLALAVLMGGVLYLFSDRFVERRIEGAGAAIVGAKVEVDRLEFSLAGLAIAWARLQVANPNDTWKNWFETGRVAFDLDVLPLLARKVHVREVSVTDMRFGTRRETDGRLPDAGAGQESEWLRQAKRSLQRRLAEAPILHPGMLKQQFDVDAVVARFDFRAPDRLDSLKAELTAAHARWRTTLAGFDPQRELPKLEAQVNELKSRDINTIEELVAALEQSKRLYDTLKAYRDRMAETKARLAGDLQALQTGFGHADDWIAADYARLHRQINLPDFTPQNVGAMLFGARTVKTVTDWLYYVDLARKYMPVAQRLLQSSKVNRPPRFQGQNIRFPVRRGSPDFLVNQVHISGATNQADTSQVLRVKGEMQGLTSHPRVYGRPLTFALEAGLSAGRGYALTGLIDHTGEIPVERFEARAAAWPLGVWTLSPRPYLPSRMEMDPGDFSGRLTLNGNRIEFALAVEARGVTFAFTDSLMRDDPIAALTSKFFRAIDALRLEASVAGEPEALVVRIRSNLDDLLAERLNSLLGQSAKRARQELRTRFDAVVAPRKQEADALFARFQREVVGEINQLESGITKQLAFLDQEQAQLEKRIAQEKKKGLKGLGKKLKGLIEN